MSCTTLELATRTKIDRLGRIKQAPKNVPDNFVTGLWYETQKSPHTRA